MKCRHILETRDCYFEDVKKKGTITWCVKEGCCWNQRKYKDVKKLKIVINGCYGGFGLSREAVLLARELSGNPKWGGATIKGDIYDDTGKICDTDFGHVDVERNDEILVKVVEQLIEKANGNYAELKIVEIPDGIEWEIDEYDGIESVHEKYRSWC
jgi:hypothetical protein